MVSPSILFGTVAGFVVVLLSFVGWYSYKTVWTSNSADGDSIDNIWYVTLILAFGLISVVAGILLGVLGSTIPNIQSAISDLLGFSTLMQYLLTLGLVVAGYILTSLADRAITRLAAEARTTIDDHQQEVLFRLLQFVVYVSITSGILSVWNIDVTGFLVGAGVLGIVIGLAARQTLSGVLAGIVLMLSQPFKIGDWVEIGGNDGRVTDMTFVHTKLRTPDGKNVVIPNDVVSNERIVNYSQRGRLRVSLTVSVDYTDSLDKAATIAECAVSDVDRIDAVPAPRATFEEFGDSGIALDVLFWVSQPSPRKIRATRTEAIHSIKNAFDDADLTIPYPQRELSYRSGETAAHDSTPPKSE